jgi:hypothetical protein
MYRSLPGEYSHRVRTLNESEWALGLNWVRELNPRRAVGDTRSRIPIRLASKSPYGSRTQLNVRLGSIATCGDTPTRPV